VFPRRSILPARIGCLGQGTPWLPEFARAVFRANFADDRDIEDPALMRDLLAEAGAAPDQAGPAALLERATAQETKDLLRAETDRAWSIGVFGAPTFVVAGELFWGNDRLEEALEWHGRAAGRRP
jgi:2-hydroxychromene-2-carboxylate isomerase